MNERKYVKLRVDMYEETKFKIIDMKPERDLIHYVWSRILTLAGKVNLEGELYLSKSMPYTVETLAIEKSTNRIEDSVINLEVKEDKRVYKRKSKSVNKEVDSITNEMLEDISEESFTYADLKSEGTVMGRWDFCSS